MKIMAFNKAQADEKAQPRLRRDELILKRSVMHLGVAQWARIPLRGATAAIEAF